MDIKIFIVNPMIAQIIFLYASFAFVDILDKFLLTGRKILPLSYDFFTLVTGALLLVIWPWVYQPLPLKFILLNLFSGAFYALMMYVYFKVLSLGEVSRVVPVIFGLVPLFDLFFLALFRHKPLLPSELGAVFLLVAGALLMAYYGGKKFYSHLLLKIFGAFLISSYNWLWQYGAQIGGSLNNLMWNRLGAAGIMLVILAIPAARKNIFETKAVPQKAHTGFLFLFKQVVGGLNFIFLSYFLASGKVPIVDGLGGFRYVFLFIFALLLSYKHRRILQEQITRKIILQKIAAIFLIFLGTLILFNRLQ